MTDCPPSLRDPVYRFLMLIVVSGCAALGAPEDYELERARRIGLENVAGDSERAGTAAAADQPVLAAARVLVSRFTRVSGYR